MKDNVKVLDHINRILSVLNENIDNIKKNENDEELFKQKLRIEVLEELKSGFEWITSPNKNKQMSRILNVAHLRREEIDVTDHLNQIELYSKIQEVIPYIMAVSYKINMEDKHLTEDLLNFCENQLEQIDLSSRSIKVSFPSIDKIEKAFKSFNERIKPNKIPVLKVYYQPEVTQKIDELYQLFLYLSNK